MGVLGYARRPGAARLRRRHARRRGPPGGPAADAERRDARRCPPSTRWCSAAARISVRRSTASHRRHTPPPSARRATTAELALLQGALAHDLPVLGVCRGMQLLNVAHGGTLVQHLPDTVGHDGHRTRPGHFDLHAVRLAPASRIAAILGTAAEVSSGHHQGLATVGDGLDAVAWAQDGSVEAVEDPSRRFLIGVLWHPEEGQDQRLFGALVEPLRAPDSPQSGDFGFPRASAVAASLRGRVPAGLDRVPPCGAGPRRLGRKLTSSRPQPVSHH